MTFGRKTAIDFPGKQTSAKLVNLRLAGRKYVICHVEALWLGVMRRIYPSAAANKWAGVVSMFSRVRSLTPACWSCCVTANIAEIVAQTVHNTDVPDSGPDGLLNREPAIQGRNEMMVYRHY